MQDTELSQSEQELIDRLIPPPWGSGRRLALAAVLAAVGIGVAVVVTGGWLAPNLEYTGSQFGGDGPVTMGMNITNNGSRTIRVLAVDDTPGTNLVHATASDRPLPTLVHPGETAMVLGTYDVVDCTAVDHDDATWGIDVEFADGPFEMRRHLDLDARDFVFDERVGGDQGVSWPAAMTQYVCE